jgi:hypothetical protein
MYVSFLNKIVDFDYFKTSNNVIESDYRMNNTRSEMV